MDMTRPSCRKATRVSVLRFAVAGGSPASVSSYGVSWLIRVDQLPSAARVPAAPGEAAHVPSLLSPVVAPKNWPPHVA